MDNQEVTKLISCDEIVITPEMIEAGAFALFGYDPEWGDSDKAVIQVYLAMESAKGRPYSTKYQK